MSRLSIIYFELFSYISLENLKLFLTVKIFFVMVPVVVLYMTCVKLIKRSLKNVNIFVVLRSPHYLEKFNEYLNTKHANIKFTNEKEVNGSLPFLDVLISRNNKGFTTTVYHKPTFSGVYSNFNSFIADEYKHGLIFTLLSRIFIIVLDFSKFYEKVNYLKDVLNKNSPPPSINKKALTIIFGFVKLKLFLIHQHRY